MKRFGPFGEGWPVVLRVYAPGHRKPVAEVKVHPMRTDRTEWYWSTHVPAEPDADDPRPVRPLLARLADDPRCQGEYLPIRHGAIRRVDVLTALANGRKKMTVQTIHQR